LILFFLPQTRAPFKKMISVSLFN